MHIGKPSKRTGHYVVPHRSELKRTLVCHHCKLKGHYARNCRTRRKGKTVNEPSKIRTVMITNNNRYKALKEQSLEEIVPNHTAAPSTRKGSTLLDTKRINQLIEENKEKGRQAKRLKILTAISQQLKILPKNKPVAIPRPEEDTGPTRDPLGGPTIAPSPLFHLSSLRRPTLRSGLDQASPLSHTQGSKSFDATIEISQGPKQWVPPKDPAVIKAGLMTIEPDICRHVIDMLALISSKVLNFSR